MSSDVQARQFDHPQPSRRQPRRVGSALLRGLGVFAVGTALAVFAAGGVSANPGSAPVAGCVAPDMVKPEIKQWDAEPAVAINTGATYTAKLESTCGTVTIALDAARAPRTVNSFVFLAGQKYFDHTQCHRMTTSGIFILQCGDPSATGMGGPGYQFPNENLDGATYPAGTVAMANAGPDTNGSQFFLVYKDSPLPPNYTPFGKITGGMDVLEKVANAGVVLGTEDGRPNADVILNSVTTTQS
ncbi:peptidylprolyl isomerase [Nocardia sp. NPDC004604]|uniref:peptidylprolyl isomerase n=1 Tax=Nocardia sp. NPDC004604 TaxID=3157013 RepID=UPI00339F7669